MLVSTGIGVNSKSYKANAMIKAESAKGVEVSKLIDGLTDVLYLTNQEQMIPEVKRLLRQKKLSFLSLPIYKFPRILHQLELVGTVIVDTKGLDVSEQQRVAEIIESLEAHDIGAILLGDRMEVPVKSFSLAPAKISFSMSDMVESVSEDELWGKISVNLAYRKKSSGIAVRAAMPPKQNLNVHGNKLTEQLDMVEALVDNLSEQLSMAGIVQRDFLPTQVPNTDEIQWAVAFLPAEWVSGDIYDIVRIDEQHIGFYVADVVGHGIPAALLTIFLKQALVMRQTTESSYHIFSPAEVMKNLNLRMAGQKFSGYQFATCCYCLLNTKTLQLTFARAGHPYPIFIRALQPPQQLETRGSLLGIFDQAEYVQQTVQLQPGDKVLLYSDGAESFIGSLDEQNVFGFNQQFCEIKDLPVLEMMDEFNTVFQNQKIKPIGIDDITVIGLEIL